MKKKLVIKSSLLIILGLVIVISLTGCSSDNKVETENEGGISNSIQESNNTVIENTKNPVDKSTSNKSFEKSKKEIVKELYINAIEERAKQYKSELSDYTIDEINLEDVPDIKLVYPESKDGDFLAYVIYSVKPTIKFVFLTLT